MWYKGRVILLGVLVAMIIVVQLLSPAYPSVVNWYAEYIFIPFQSFRNFLFGWSQLSIGDLLYFAGGLVILAIIVRWVYFLITIKTNGRYLVRSILNTFVVLAVVYLVFMIGWGGNYYKPTLTEYWGLDTTGWKGGVSEYELNEFLTERLNSYSTRYEPLEFKQVRKQSEVYYKDYTNCKARLHGLNVKPSIYGYLMQHMGIQGYYNPITGEAQVNRFLPKFMLPFVVLHEMAHQAGIAAEDDANLLAYSIGLKSEQPAFVYSSYLNMWLYNHYRIRKTDSLQAEVLKANLNPMTLQHIDTLAAIRQKYKGNFNTYSGKIYDQYLKMLQQEEGIKSYNRSIESVWEWEKAADTIRGRKRLIIP